jgi:hypothetical protein
VIAYELERGEQHVADATEVVQDQRLVEASRPGYLACAGARESSRLHPLEPLAAKRREQVRELWASVARAQQSAGEEIGPTGPRPGEFPQAFTHLALVCAAGNLDRQLG